MIRYLVIVVFTGTVGMMILSKIVPPANPHYIDPCIFDADDFSACK